jgi:protein-tyrosine phosphatase
MAEIHLRHLTGDMDRVHIRSAGVMAVSDSEIYEDAGMVLQENNLPAEHASRQLTKPLIEWADLILVMEDIQKEYVTILSPESKNKIAFLRNFNAKNRQPIIDDPVGKEIKFCREAFEIIKESNKRLEEYLRNKF